MEIKRHYWPERVKKYEARWYVEGRLKSRFFPNENERERFIADFSEQVTHNGTRLLLGSDPARMRRWQEASRAGPGCGSGGGHADFGWRPIAGV